MSLLWLYFGLETFPQIMYLTIDGVLCHRSTFRNLLMSLAHLFARCNDFLSDRVTFPACGEISQDLLGVETAFDPFHSLCQDRLRQHVALRQACFDLWPELLAGAAQADEAGDSEVFDDKVEQFVRQGGETWLYRHNDGVRNGELGENTINTSSGNVGGLG